jgi:hypothetical protein
VILGGNTSGLAGPADQLLAQPVGEPGHPDGDEALQRQPIGRSGSAAAGALALLPAAASGPVGGQAVLTAVATDAGGGPMIQTPVAFAVVSGPNVGGGGLAVTDASLATA